MKNVAVMLDVTSLPYGRGVARYTSNLARALVNQPNLSLSLFGTAARRHEELNEWLRQFGSHVETTLWPLPPTVLHLLWKHLRWPTPWLGKNLSNQVFHAWDWSLPPVAKVPLVVTIHDLAHKLYPEVALPEVVARYDETIKILEQDERIQVIAVSQTTKNDIVNLTAIAPERITVIHEALPIEATVEPSLAEQQVVRRQLDLHKPFFLWVGTAEPRKNLQRLVQAWEKTSREIDLVLVGDVSAVELPKTSGLRVMGRLDGWALAALYRQAEALVFPSLYEGFGLPILEAFAHDCVVVTSKMGSMPEVAGEAALYVDPYSIESMTEVLDSVPSKIDKKHDALVRKMKLQLKRFSWDKTAAETVKVYEKAVAHWH